MLTHTRAQPLCPLSAEAVEWGWQGAWVWEVAEVRAGRAWEWTHPLGLPEELSAPGPAGGMAVGSRHLCVSLRVVDRRAGHQQ